jgi:pimeloyl-ACP methyl ester carboxylesterase
MRLRKVQTPFLHLAFEEDGPKKGEALLLAHGWPDSPRTWDKILPYLHEAGYRTITPYHRGCAPTSFRDPILGRRRRRTGQPVALAQDMVDLADKLGIKQFHFIGHDWGARTGYALSALFPQRLKSLVAISVPFAPGRTQLPKLNQARAYWYQWLLCTELGEKSFREDPVAFARAQWDTWSTLGWYTDEEFEEAAKSWTGEDFQDVVLHYYRSRLGEAKLDPNYDVLQERFLLTRSLSTPTLLLQGMEDRCVLPETTDGAGRHFSSYQRILLDSSGHFPQREEPAAVSAAILDHINRNR